MIGLILLFGSRSRWLLILLLAIVPWRIQAGSSCPATVPTVTLTLLVDAGDRDRWYAGTRRGLYRSDNGGYHWQKVTTMASGAVLSLYQDPGQWDTLLAGTAGGIRRSDNGGYHWYTPDGSPRGAVTRVMGDLQRGERRYAISEQGLFVSDTAGLHWQRSGRSLAVADYPRLTPSCYVD